MPRAQNAHAYVNAGFLFKVDKKNKFKVLEKPNIVFGGINSTFVSITRFLKIVLKYKLKWGTVFSMCLINWNLDKVDISSSCCIPQSQEMRGQAF